MFARDVAFKNISVFRRTASDLTHIVVFRRNLQRHIKGLAPLTEDQFDSAISAAGHSSSASSISGSASEGSSDTGSDGDEVVHERNTQQRDLSHLIVQHPTGSLYVCWSTVFDVADDGQAMPVQPAYWSQPTAVILCSGGHFAATLFERNRVLKSKTFHRYVVRAKQVLRALACSGVHLNGFSGRKAGVTRPKETHQQASFVILLLFCKRFIMAFHSAGSSLRRHNEQQLHQVSSCACDCATRLLQARPSGHKGFIRKLVSGPRKLLPYMGSCPWCCK